MNKIASILSYIFHPIFMPFLGLFLLFQTNLYFVFLIPNEARDLLYSFSAINTIAIPLLSIFFLYKKGFIKSFQMDEKYERWYPLFIVSAFNYFTYYLLNSFNIPSSLSSIFLGTGIATTVAFFFNWKWKISLHTIGISGLIGLFFATSQLFLIDLFVWIATSTIVLGVIAASRLKITNHTTLEVYLGAFIGFVCVYITCWFTI